MVVCAVSVPSGTVLLLGHGGHPGTQLLRHPPYDLPLWLPLRSGGIENPQGFQPQHHGLLGSGRKPGVAPELQVLYSLDVTACSQGPGNSVSVPNHRNVAMTVLIHGWPVWSRSSRVIMRAHHPHAPTTTLQQWLVLRAPATVCLMIWKMESVTESARGGSVDTWAGGRAGSWPLGSSCSPS